MTGRVRVGRVDDVPLDRAIAVADGRVVLVRSASASNSSTSDSSTSNSSTSNSSTSDEIVGFENRCLHADQPLADGVVSDGVLMCPHHFWRYEISTGLLTSSGPAASPSPPLASVPVEVIDGEVFIETPKAEPVRSTRELLLEHARTWKRDEST